MKRILIVIMLVLPAMAQAQVGSRADDRYIVMFAAGTSEARKAAAVERAGAMLRFNYSIVNAVAVRIPNANALAALRNDGSILSIIPDRAIHAIEGIQDIGASGKPGSGGGGGGGQVIPEGVKRVGVPTSTSNGETVGVAILDTGIDLAHADLAVSSIQFSSFGGSCQDNNGHGTHVAGIVGARDNTTGVVGVAPKATLYCVKVLDASGSGSDSDVIAGLDFVYGHRADTNIRVVNMSLGRDGSIDDNTVMRTAVQKLYGAGITVVVAAGNDPTKEVKTQVPAGYPEVLAVASTTAIAGTNACKRFASVIKADTASYFTTDGAYDTGTKIGVTISAPGEDQENIITGCLLSPVGILSTKLGGGTTRMSGTSMASPHVAGIAARIIQKGTDWTPEAIRDVLRSHPSGTVVLVPFDSPASGYSFDGEREGIAVAP